MKWLIGILLIAAIMVAALTLARVRRPRPADTQRAMPFRPPDVRADTFETVTSRNGVLETRLTAVPESTVIGVYRFASMVYNGRYLPPVLRVNPGDSLRLQLINHLPADQMTNLHYHGTRVSPKAPSDDIFLHVQPGSVYDYRVFFARNHDRGLFWYHPHAHGHSERQVTGGMSGVLVVEGFLTQFYPALRALPERILMLKAFEPSGYRDGQPQTKTLNGMTHAILRVHPGELQFWRVANIAANSYFELRIPGVRMWLLASDANPLRRPQRIDSIFLPPGARAELVVEGPPAGRYSIRNDRYDTGPQGDPNPAVILGTLISEGCIADTQGRVDQLERPTSQLLSVAAEIDSLRTHPITRRRTFVFSESADGGRFFINGKQFDPNRIDTSVRLGDVEEWTIENMTGEVHAFHVHQTDFLVTSINGVPQASSNLHDTINLPHAVNGRPGVVKIIVPFTDPTIVGKFVYHCHILEHEDGGMMATVQVTSIDRAVSRTGSDN